MRVTWFTNVPFPSAALAAGRQPAVIGGWLHSLGNALLVTGEVQLQVITFVSGGQDQSVFVEGCRHDLIALPQREFSQQLWFYPKPAVRERCRRLVAEFEPEVLHFHGTEASYGLLLKNGDLSGPAVISMQGILWALQRCWGGGIPASQRFGSFRLRDLFGTHGLYRGAALISKRIREVELPIFQNRAIFVGRTLYDRACLRAVNPQAEYRHCDEVLRPCFYRTERDAARIVQHSVFTSASGSPLKGFHFLLKSIALLKKEFPDLILRVPRAVPGKSLQGYGYNCYLYRLIEKLDLKSHIEFLDTISGERMAEELACAHAYAYPSYADNSPNGLCEALMVGTPVVASYAGGIPSLVKEGETALCFPPGDEAILAERLRELFLDNALSQRLGRQAREDAIQRHNPASIARTMLDIYSSAIDLYGKMSNLTKREETDDCQSARHP
jgi:glycosyltransferase involved in cell wall biosynthesis